MSARGKSKSIQASKDQIRKLSPKGLKNILNAFSRRIFSRIHKNEVEYGQTLSKKRRKNCILKSVSSLSAPQDDFNFLLRSPYHISFKFSREDNHFRGNVLNFQKIDLKESCCEKCFCNMKKGGSLSRFSISSDSACEVSSESSCDDLYCEYRQAEKKAMKRIKKRSKSAGDVSRNKERTLQNFIRIHNENFENEMTDAWETRAVDENMKNSILEWNEEPRYESLVPRRKDPVLQCPEYDVLITKSNYRVLEPSYENLKLIDSFYETPKSLEGCSEEEKIKDLVRGSKTYDEVIESLKLWHMRQSESGETCSCCEQKTGNEYIESIEGYESLENDFNNDIEEFSC